MVTAERARSLITGGDPDAPAGVPVLEQFIGLDFLPDKRLSDIGQLVVAKKFIQLDGAVTIDFLWKAKGGTSGGNLVLGKCIKNSGLARHYSNYTDYTVWIAADHSRSYGFNRWQLEALIFHELLHIDYEEPEEEGAAAVKGTKGHDAELFYSEIEEYGLWRRSLQRLSEVVQPALPLD